MPLHAYRSGDRKKINRYSHEGFIPLDRTFCMYLDSEKKAEIFGKYGTSSTDTGSPESQIALFTYRISHLTEHMKENHKDFNTSRAMKGLIGKRRRLLDYLMKKDIERYRAIIKELGIRR